MPMFVALLLLGIVGAAPRAQAQEARSFPPTRLEFDAARAPKACNDHARFLELLETSADLPKSTPEASQRLVVRIRRTPTGGKLAEVSLLDAAGAVLREEHQRYGVSAECHRVLYEAARAAARLLGAFEPPPPPPPCPACAACTACPAPAEPVRCPACPVLEKPAPRVVLTPSAARRTYVGAGVFIGTGIASAPAWGPRLSVGFVPSVHFSRIQFEFDAAWAGQSASFFNAAEALRVHTVPLAGSICYSRYVFRMCSGLTTTIFSAEAEDNLRLTAAAHLRLVSEFEISGPFLLRIEAFTMLRWAQRTFGAVWAHVDGERDEVAAGGAIMGVWSME